MAYEPKDNTGSLFKNDRASSEKHPQATGSAIIDGVEYFLDAWTNIDKNGNRYQSLKFKRKDKQPSAKPKSSCMYERDDPRTARSRDDDDTGEIPF